jgi:hypothetical protein
VRPLLYIVAALLALPQLLITSAFLLLDHVTGGGTLGTLLSRIVNVLFLFFSWGGAVVLVLMLLFLAIGFSTRWRPIGAALLVLLVVSSTTSLLVLLGSEMTPDQVFVFIPGLIAAAIGIGLSDYRRFASAFRKNDAAAISQPSS